MEFRVLAEAYEKLEATRGRLEMMAILSELFKEAKSDEIDKIIYLSQGVIAPPFEGIEVGLGEKFVEEAISLATGYQVKKVEEVYRRTGDLGKTAEELLLSKKQMSLFSHPLSVQKVFDNFMKMAKTSGAGSQDAKIKRLAELLNNATPKEASYIARFPVGKLRLGIGDPTILDALSAYKAGDKSLREELERAYNLCSDLGLVARTLFSDGIEGIRKFRIKVFNPIRPALAERLPSAEEIIEKIGKCAVERKYDGLRMQIHKQNEKVEIFSRRLERMTHMFPEIVAGVRKQVRAKDAILEGEALAYNETSGEYYPFQLTMQRKRKYGVKEKAEEYPLKLFAFDILYADGEDFTKRPYHERRKTLERLIAYGDVLKLSEMMVADDPKELEAFFEESIEKGMEGIVAKDLNAEYVAGARKFAWIKLKRSYKGELADTVDLVIIGYFLGKGMRAKFKFGGLLCAVYDEKEDVFRSVAKIGSGFSEEQMKQFEEMLGRIKVDHKLARVDSEIKPDFWVDLTYVVTVAADEITRSPTHTAGKGKGESGYALRFPRMVDLRGDKSPEEATTVAEIIEMYKMQKRTQLEET
ncbi:MAG: ATP-dependent DNA ligase [Candidatus Fermentimicrarchaeum limneticum]|uniref:DNA ligase n=1 Tax=Fermentimicrarchaeum limneticum TaxID=2795018 RepID=A0A7D5XPE5_FERL1|nr:MAG: ATP-dependent DNA ligase [Candidatus Fermentimicrarchaeum limneticum]